jgi:hypothetical protein
LSDKNPYSLWKVVSEKLQINRGSDGAMGSWSNINLAVLFCNLRMRLSPSFEQFPQTTQQ